MNVLKIIALFGVASFIGSSMSGMGIESIKIPGSMIPEQPGPNRITQITRVEDCNAVKYRTDRGETTVYKKQGKYYTTKPVPYDPVERYSAIEALFLKAKEYNEENPQSESALARVEHITKARYNY